MVARRQIGRADSLEAAATSDYQLPDLSTTPVPLELAIQGWVAHVKVETTMSLHPALSSAIASKLAGRHPVVWMGDRSVEVQFAVEDDSSNTMSRVGQFALRMVDMLGASIEDVTRAELSRQKDPERDRRQRIGDRTLRLITDATDGQGTLS
ncbi:hypothetical protein CH262_25805 [Rhodococcus sp. 05-2255-1e]|nr:hypothetical protein CH262_25805 [Rhodococcus sp. 05-2255-1e]